MRYSRLVEALCKLVATQRNEAFDSEVYITIRKHIRAREIHAIWPDLVIGVEL